MIGSIIHAATVVLTWGASPTPVTGYRVHIGAQPGVYSEVLPVGNVTSIQYTTNDDNQTTYFAVSAVAGPKESAKSNEVADPKKPDAPTLSLTWE